MSIFIFWIFLFNTKKFSWFPYLKKSFTLIFFRMMSIYNFLLLRPCTVHIGCIANITKPAFSIGLFYEIKRLVESIRYSIQGRHARELGESKAGKVWPLPRFWVIQYTLLRNNQWKSFWVEYWTLPGSNSPWQPCDWFYNCQTSNYIEFSQKQINEYYIWRLHT